MKRASEFEKKNKLMKRWRKITDLLDTAEEMLKKTEYTLYCGLYYDEENDSCNECPLYEAGICEKGKVLDGIKWMDVGPVFIRTAKAIREAKQNAGQIFSTIYGDVWGENE